MISSAAALVTETSPITEELHTFRGTIEATVDLADPRLARIVRLRLLTDRGFPMWDLSYCWGELKDGTPVRVDLPRHQFSKRLGLARELTAMCKEAGVYGKGLGILDAVSTLS